MQKQKGFISIVLAGIIALILLSVGVAVENPEPLTVGAGSGTVTPLPVKSFLGLNDTPNSYSGQANKVVSVKSDASGLEFTAAGGGGTWGSITGTLSSQTDLQTALDAKAPLTSPTFGTSITGSYLTASQLLGTDGSKNIVSLTTATYPSLTELSYGKGVTSAIQTQIDSKVPSTRTLTINGSALDLSANRSWTTEVPLTFSTGLTRSTNTITVNTSQNIGTLSNLTSNGFVKTSGGTGALSVDTGSYQPLDSDLTTIAGLTATTDNFIISNASAWASRTPTQARTSLGLATTDSPMFTNIELGHASDTTLSRVSAGVMSVEGVTVDTISGTNTLSNKTLTAPKFANGGFIADANGNEEIIFNTTASAVNELTLANAATAGNPKITMSGGDANVGLDILTKATGTVNLLGNSTQASELRMYEDTDDGTNFSAFRASPRSANITYTMPTSDPTANQVLTASAPSSNVSTLSWSTPSGGSTIPKVKFGSMFETAGRFTATNSGGTATFGTLGVTMTTTSTAGRYASVALTNAGNFGQKIYAQNPSFSAGWRMEIGSNDSGTAAYFVGLGTPTLATTGITFTPRHVGFKMLKSGTTTSLYATQADGTTETASSALTTIGQTDWVEVSFVVTGTSVDYYWSVNGGARSSATTLSTNYPTYSSGADDNFQFMVTNSNTAARATFSPAHFSYER